MLLAAGDTFRAAAREQLAAWGERNGVTVIQQQGGDAGRRDVRCGRGGERARGIDVVLADTAGRLPTQAHLMDELRKVKRVLGKAREGAARRGLAGPGRQYRPERARAGPSLRRRRRA